MRPRSKSFTDVEKEVNQKFRRELLKSRLTFYGLFGAIGLTLAFLLWLSFPSYKPPKFYEGQVVKVKGLDTKARVLYSFGCMTDDGCSYNLRTDNLQTATVAEDELELAQ